MDDLPKFETWDIEELVSFAEKAYRQMCADADAKEQLRMDNKDLSKLLRKQIKGESNE